MARCPSLLIFAKHINIYATVGQSSDAYRFRLVLNLVN